MTPVPTPPDREQEIRDAWPLHAASMQGTAAVTINELLALLDAARAEVTRLTAERESAKRQTEAYKRQFQSFLKARGERDRLAARCALLENTLREIADGSPSLSARKIARAALDASEQEET